MLRSWSECHQEDSVTHEPRKLALLALLERGRQEEHDVWDLFPEAEKAAAGTFEHWGLKDLVAHISEWKDRDASRLDSANQRVAPEEPADFDQANTGIFEAHRHKSWLQVVDFEARAFSHLVSSVKALSEEVLLDPQAYAWTEGRTPSWIAAFTGYSHPQDHLSRFLVERGDLETAETIQLRIVEAMGSIDESPRAKGASLYNLACFYALNGMADRAINNLSVSFPLRPDLVDWSKKDSDLDSLRGMAAFQALYGA